MSQSIQLVIITGQPQANLIPVLQFKPEIVALAVSDAMQEACTTFIALLKNVVGYGDEQIIVYSDLPEISLQQIESYAISIRLDMLQRFPDAALTYNATGGTKLMILGLYNSLDADRVIYCDSLHAQIHQIKPKASESIAIDPCLLTIESYLRSMGQQFRSSSSDEPRWQEAVQHRKPLTKWLVKNLQLLQPFLGVINWLSHQALQKVKRGQPMAIAEPDQHLDREPHGIWKEALQRYHEYGVLEWNEACPMEIHFTNVLGTSWIGGGWLEEYVWLIACELRFHEIRANVVFTALGRPKDDIRNEMDLVILHNNRLLLIEVKTANLLKESEKSSDILYKLDSISHKAGGMMSEKWLITARPLGKPAHNRALDSQIHLIENDELKNLKEHLRSWMNRGG